MARYDEDLHENVFFHTLVTKFSELFREAAENKWMILVPRCDTASRLRLTRSDFENHILRPKHPLAEATSSFSVEGGGGGGGREGESDEGGTAFVSVNNKLAVINGDTVTVGHGYKEPRAVKILFDECFYNSSDESYQVFCLDQPMEGALGEEMVIKLENIEDCNRYLWGDVGSERVRKSVDRLLDMFQLERGTTLRPIMDAASAVYTRAVQEVFKLRKFQSSGQRIFCKLAVETYVMAGLHKKVFKETCFIVAQKDATLNKITRNLSDTHPQYLGVKPQFRLLIPKARAILSQLNQFTTPLEKLYCFKHCISVLMTSPLDGSSEVVTADELLPILVYLVIVCDIPNWNGNLQYITKFHFSTIGIEEFAYFLTSFEAAVEYVRNEAQQLATVNISASGINTTKFKRLRSNSGMADEETDPIKSFFKSICKGDVEAVKVHLKHLQTERDEMKAKMCHPLCNCKECTALQERQIDEADKEASVYARDEDGRTALHHAARLGYNDIVTLLLEQGALVSATDHNSSTPLHLACQKGHQKCTLLLLGDGSSINAADHHGNTPLHLACSNGHEECVKALLFHKGQCRVNPANHQGDTPLHNAARWGYASIVSVLLDHGALTTIVNRRRELPHQCAQSRKVQELLAAMSRKQLERGNVVDGGTSVDLVHNFYDESPPTLKKVQRSKRMSREFYSENDRALKKLFRAIQDGDINYVRYLFGWDETGRPAMNEELCHPLCQCDRCSKLRKGSTITVNSCDSRGYTPLHKAALLGQRKMVQLLLEHSAYIEARTFDNQHSPLHLACQYNHRDIVMVLLEHSAQVNPQDVVGNTPLHFTSSNGHMDAATLLLIHGADVSLANHRGDTPLHSAARWNHPTLVNELLLYGSLYTVTNNVGKTPMDLTTDDEVSDILTRAMTGEIAVGSYQPLPSINKDSSRVSTTPIPARSGRGGVIQRSMVISSGQPVSEKAKQAYQRERADRPKKVDRRTQADRLERAEQHEQADHLERTEQREQADRYEQANRHTQADRPEKKDAVEVKATVHAAKTTEEKWLLVEKEAKEEAGHQSHEDVLEIEKESEKASQSAVEVVTRREKNKLRDLLRAIESYDRRASMRPTSTYDRSAPILSFSSSQSSSTSTTPPDHAHIGFLSSLTHSNILSLTEEAISAPHSSDGASTVQQEDSADSHLDSGATGEVFPDPEFDDQELKTITRQMIATALETSSVIAAAPISSALEQSKDGASGQQSSDSSPLLISRPSAVDSEEQFGVLVASCSDDDWQPI